jgi:hypothetical protein
VVPTGPTLQFTIRQKAQSVGVPLTSWYVNGLELADAGKLPARLTGTSIGGDGDVVTETPPVTGPGVQSTSPSMPAGAPTSPTTDPTLYSGSSSGMSSGTFSSGSISGTSLSVSSLSGSSVAQLHDAALAGLGSLDEDQKKKGTSEGSAWDPTVIDSLFRGLQ